MAQNTKSIDLELSSSQHLEIADASQTGLDLAGDFSISLWVNFESLPGSGVQSLFVAKWNSADDNRSYQFGLFNDAGTLKIQANISSDGLNSDTVRWDWTPSTATWYHVTLVCDVSNAVSTEFEFFLNAATQGNGTVVADGSVGAIFNGTADFNVGALANTAASFFDGLVDEVVVTSDILTAGEIVLLKEGNTPTTASLDNVKGYWALNDLLTDASGNSNTLTAVNTPVFSATVPFANYAGGTSDRSHFHFM